MPRLLVHVEGETEETFVNEILRDHLVSAGFEHVSARIVGNARLRHRRGGIRGWDSVRKDILRHLREDTRGFSTTMVDYYALPQSGPGAWPGRADASDKTFDEKANSVESALAADISAQVGSSFDRQRFLPFVVMHEFEGLLFSDCTGFSKGIARPDLESAFQQIRNTFHSPEEINDSPATHPSKRVENLVPHYEKPLLGTLAILEIGLVCLRHECPHFAHWINTLERLAK